MNRIHLSGMSYEALFQSTQERLDLATRRRPVTLVIAHHDSILIRRLLHQLPEQEVILLEHSQADWDFGSTRFRKTLHSYLSMHSLKNILLIGHSTGVPSKVSASSCVEHADHDSHGEAGNRPHWLRRSEMAQRRIQQARQHFIEQFHELQETLRKISTQDDHQVELAGLLYIAGSGVLAKYCPATGDTEPLILAESETGCYG